MPRGNEDNLIPFNELTEEEQKEIASKGGKASVEARRRKKTLAEELLALLEVGDTQEKISVAQIKKALSGDTKAFLAIRDTVGEKPTEKIEQTGDINITLARELEQYAN